MLPVTAENFEDTLDSISQVEAMRAMTKILRAAHQLSAVSLNRLVSDLRLVLEKRKPFDIAADGLLLYAIGLAAWSPILYNPAAPAARPPSPSFADTMGEAHHANTLAVSARMKGDQGRGGLGAKPPK